MPGPLYIAVDLGAGSGRVFACGVDPGELLLDEVHRFQYPPRLKDGHLRWDLELIFREIKTGLTLAAKRANELCRPIKSVGVDSWAVDYGLLDAKGEVIADPVCYRDDRTKGVMERVFEKVPRSLIFDKTGIQFQPFNTIYQLAAEDDFADADKLLLLPDLINFYLTGVAKTEYTNATTTQLVNASTGNWDDELIDRLKIPRKLFTDIVSAGTVLGELKPEIAAETGLENIAVVAPATHDTASAVAGTPLEANWAYISSGTWSLVGVERREPLIVPQAEHLNFTNEGGAYGTFRLLKNVMGLWIFESCRREWLADGVLVEYDQLIDEIETLESPRAFIFPDDERFLNPPSMLSVVYSQLGETGQTFDEKPASVSRIIFDSLAFRYNSVVGSIRQMTGERLEGILVVGGGGRNRYLNQATADATRLPVRTGLTEATVVGNLLVQAVSSGRFASLAEARRHVRDNFVFDEFEPRDTPEIRQAAAKYAAVESAFVGARSVALS